ncbi:MAG: hypothetical protein ABI824_18330 [Acidobacteriota bacterium]
MFESLPSGTFLFARSARLPPTWELEDASVGRGWSRLTSKLDSLMIEKLLAPTEWKYFFMADGLTATCFGFNRKKMLDCALERLTTAVRRRACNSLEIHDVSMQSYFGFPYVSISAHARHIQTGSFFIGQS